MSDNYDHENPQTSTKLPPIGVRQNNPGNIDSSTKFQWDGEIPSPNRFCAFVSPQKGMRAMLELLWNYTTKDGCHTLRDIVNRWAPPNENNTISYMNAVIDWLHLNTTSSFYNHSTVDFKNNTDDLIAIAMAFTHIEQGYEPYHLGQWQLALQELQQEGIVS